jgi:hypothetical protein
VKGERVLKRGRRRAREIAVMLSRSRSNSRREWLECSWWYKGAQGDKARATERGDAAGGVALRDGSRRGVLR